MCVCSKIVALFHQHNDPVKEYRGKKKVELTKDDILCPEGWKWCDSPAGQWQVDMEQAVDKNGQYKCCSHVHLLFCSCGSYSYGDLKFL